MSYIKKENDIYRKKITFLITRNRLPYHEATKGGRSGVDEMLNY
ncbi:MAG: hypothetical protein N4A64_11050 [Marinisporobacter sp.]|nr:hypothetical protein [Marinisporobacter sp.]